MKFFSEPFFVAEISANHNGSLSKTHSLVEKAKLAGAHAVKFQTYTAKSMTLDLPKFTVSNQHELWAGKNLYELYREAAMPWEWHQELFQHARELGIIPFSSPFDQRAVELLEDLDCPIYKIASLENGDLELIIYAAQTMKPIIISTGASELEEIRIAIDAALSTGNNEISLLVCTSSYPAKVDDSHIRRIETLKKEFGLNVGISDHTLGIGASVAAIALGATIVEKHFTNNRNDGGFDAAFSMEPQEFSVLVKEGQSAYRSLGSNVWKIQESERLTRNLRRSLFIVMDVKKGEIASVENVRAIRPNGGVPPEKINQILGKKFISDFAAGTPANPEIVV